jgi:hypothetical protein
MGTGGAQADNRFGAAVSSGGLNNDGYGDLTVGIRLKDANGIVDSGALSIRADRQRTNRLQQRLPRAFIRGIPISLPNRGA